MYQIALAICKSIFRRSVAAPTKPPAEHDRIAAALLADHVHELSVRDDLIAELEADTFRFRLALEAAGVTL